MKPSRVSFDPRPSSQSCVLPSVYSIMPSCARRSRRGRHVGRRRFCGDTSPAFRKIRCTLWRLTVTPSSFLSFSQKCVSFKPLYLPSANSTICFRTESSIRLAGAFPRVLDYFDSLYCSWLKSTLSFR